MKNNELISFTLNAAIYHTSTSLDRDSGYMVPTKIQVVYDGKTADATPVKLSFLSEIENPLDKIDILAQLPFLIRKFIQAFISKPFVYSWLVPLTVNLTIGDETHEITGKMFYESSFLTKVK